MQGYEATRAKEKVVTIAAVRAALDLGNRNEAAELLRSKYPFAPQPSRRKTLGPLRCSEIFVRDGFIDRYSGDRLIFPPVLRVLSALMPDEFPYHPAWKTDCTHPAYWEVGATVDHLVPVVAGGSDASENLVTTSMALNSVKQNWSLEHLGWKLVSPGRLCDWDGGLLWFLQFTAGHPDVVMGSTMQQWQRAARAAAGQG